MVAGGKDCLNLTFADVIPDNPLGICCCGCCTIVNLILIILFFPCTVTQLGQFKYGLVKNTITGIVDLDQVFYPGRYWIGFWKTFIEFPSTLNTIEFSDESPEKGVKQLSVLSARDRDGKQLYLDISVQYRLRPEQLGKIYKDMTILYEDVYISDLRDKLAKAAQKFGGAQFWENFAEVQAEMFESCQVHLQDRHAICWGLQLWGVKVNKDWEDRLILTQVKTQQAKTAVWDKAAGLYRAETKKNLAQYTKDIIIERSRGESLVYRIERQAVALAEARRVEAGAKVLKIIKDTVRFKSGNCTDAEENLTYASWMTEENSNCTITHGPAMTDDQLVRYQQLTMLQSHVQAPVVYDLGRSGISSSNAGAARNLLSEGRRLGANVADL